MTENKTKIIDLKDNEKDKFLSQLKKNKRKKSKIVDTGKVHDVSAKAENDNENQLENLWNEDFKIKYKNPFKRIYGIINEEELNESTSEALVRFFGIIFGLIILIGVIIFGSCYYFFYSSYSANYRRGQNAEQTGNYEAALKYYGKALDKTENAENKVTVLHELIRLSEEQGADLNVKSYLFELIKADPENSDAVIKLKNLYLEAGDLDSIFNLASEISKYKTSELLYDIIENQPVFNYKSGTYDEPLSISISSSEDCKVYYTVDGSEASENSTPYSEPIQISDLGETTIHAISINVDGVKSKDYFATYNIISNEVEAPNVFPASGTYVEDTEIVIEIPSGYEAYYTLDGSEPNVDSQVYKKGMIIPYGNHIFTVKFIGLNGNESESVSRVFIFEPDYDITLNEAFYFLKKELINAGILTDSANNMDSIFKCSSIITFDKELFYCVNMTDAYNGDSEYAVHVNNGAVFKLNKDQFGNYYLDAVK